MTLSQRKKYNAQMRLYKLRRAIREGRVPQARKPLTHQMIAEYRKHGVEYAVTFPQEWMDDNTLRGIKEDHQTLRRAIRNQLPANCPRKVLSAVVKLYASGRITLQEIRNISSTQLDKYR